MGWVKVHGRSATVSGLSAWTLSTPVKFLIEKLSLHGGIHLGIPARFVETLPRQSRYLIHDQATQQGFARFPVLGCQRIEGRA
jgi:hypothetical protein